MEYTMHFNSVSVGGGGAHLSNPPRSVSDELIKRGLAWVRHGPWKNLGYLFRVFRFRFPFPVSRVCCSLFVVGTEKLSNMKHPTWKLVTICLVPLYPPTLQTRNINIGRSTE